MLYIFNSAIFCFSFAVSDFVALSCHFMCPPLGLTIVQARQDFQNVSHETELYCRWNLKPKQTMPGDDDAESINRALKCFASIRTSEKISSISKVVSEWKMKSKTQDVKENKQIFSTLFNTSSIKWQTIIEHALGLAKGR